MKYLHGVSIRKGGSAALPVVPACVLIWAARQFWGVEIPPEVGAAMVGMLSSIMAYARNRGKHGWRGRA